MQGSDRGDLRGFLWMDRENSRKTSLRLVSGIRTGDFQNASQKYVLEHIFSVLTAAIVKPMKDEIF
jgi:hypothetical protein